MIILTGATGTIGRTLAPALVASAHDVAAITRTQAALLPTGVRRIVGDLTKPESLRGAMDGAGTLILITSGLDQLDQESNALHEATAAGINRVIKVSVMSARRDAMDRITHAHRTIESDLRASTLEWAVVRCNAFMSNTLNWRWTIASAGTVYVPFADKPVSAVAPEDIAGMIEVLVDRVSSGEVLEATGPEAISPAQQVAILAEQLRRDIAVVDVPPDAFRSQLMRRGMHPEMATALIAIMAEALDSDTARISHDVERLLGRRPTTFSEWVTENLSSFQL